MSNSVHQKRPRLDMFDKLRLVVHTPEWYVRQSSWLLGSFLLIVLEFTILMVFSIIFDRLFTVFEFIILMVFSVIVDLLLIVLEFIILMVFSVIVGLLLIVLEFIILMVFSVIVGHLLIVLKFTMLIVFSIFVDLLAFRFEVYHVDDILSYYGPIIGHTGLSC
ncbi:hypothetical protein OROGR_003911 [Orobanche gracilis]